MLSPEFRRELIRLANRDRQNHEGVIDLIMTGDMVYARSNRETRDLIRPEDIFAVWKGSFDEHFEP